MMSVVVILVLFETVRFLIKDKKRNTFIKICLSDETDTTKL